MYKFKSGDLVFPKVVNYYAQEFVNKEDLCIILETQEEIKQKEYSAFQKKYEQIYSTTFLCTGNVIYCFKASMFLFLIHHEIRKYEENK